MMANRWKKRPATYREKRARAYEAEVGNGPGKDNAIGDCLDALFKEITAIRNGDPVTDDFQTIGSRIQGIKARYPKVES